MPPSATMDNLRRESGVYSTTAATKNSVAVSPCVMDSGELQLTLALGQNGKTWNVMTERAPLSRRGSRLSSERLSTSGGRDPSQLSTSGSGRGLKTDGSGRDNNNNGGRDNNNTGAYLKGIFVKTRRRKLAIF